MPSFLERHVVLPAAEAALLPYTHIPAVLALWQIVYEIICAKIRIWREISFDARVALDANNDEIIWLLDDDEVKKKIQQVQWLQEQQELMVKLIGQKAWQA